MWVEDAHAARAALGAQHAREVRAVDAAPHDEPVEHCGPSPLPSLPHARRYCCL